MSHRKNPLHTLVRGGGETCAHGAYQRYAPSGQIGDVRSSNHGVYAPVRFSPSAPQALAGSRDLVRRRASYAP